jgi:hypothetical protein
VSSNTHAKRGPLQEEVDQPQHKQRGRSTTSVDGGFVHHSHKSSSSGHKNHEVTMQKEERIMKDVWVMEMTETPLDISWR